MHQQSYPLLGIFFKILIMHHYALSLNLSFKQKNKSFFKLKFIYIRRTKRGKLKVLAKR